MVQLEKYFDFSLYSHHFSLLSLTSLLSVPKREVTSPSDFKVVGPLATHQVSVHLPKQLQRKRFLEIDQPETRIACVGHVC